MKQGIILNQVSFSYQNKLPALNNINLEIKPGDFLGITGKNGSGKTTLLYLFNGLIPHFYKGMLSGDISVEGIQTTSSNIATLSKKVGLLFQNPDLSLFNLTVEEEVEFGLRNLGIKNVEKRTDEALKSVNMHDFKTRDPQTLSYGEKQKIVLAGILAMDPPYIILDEPTAMLDHVSSLTLYRLLDNLNKHGKTIVVVEHDTDFLLHYAKNTSIIDKGQIILSGKTAEVFQEKKLLTVLGIKIPQWHND